MRNKVAKKLRKEARELAVFNSFPYEGYAVKTYKKVATKLDGSPVVYQVYTAFLTNDCERKLYKQLKKVNKEMLDEDELAYLMDSVTFEIKIK